MNIPEIKRGKRNQWYLIKVFVIVEVDYKCLDRWYERGISMDEQKNKSKIMIYIIVIGILLWGFYIIQEEFAKYGMYQLISYGVHEISSVIPLLCILVTILCVGYMAWCWIKKKADKTDKILLGVLVLCFCLQAGYFHKQSEMVHTAAICTIEEVHEAEERIVITIDGRSERIELKSPMIVKGMLVEKEQKYLIDFVWNKNRPDKGELHMISIVD